MFVNPELIAFKKSLINESGLNTVEFWRVAKDIYRIGIRDDQNFDRKIDTTVPEKKSGYTVHVIYFWRKSREDENILHLKYVKKTKKSKKFLWGG